MIIWRGYGFLLDACLGQRLAQLLDFQLLVSEPALQLDSPPLKSNASLSACILSRYKESTLRQLLQSQG